MKTIIKLLWGAAILLYTNPAFAQVDVKLNPLFMYYSAYQGAMEIGLNNKFSLGLDVLYSNGGFLEAEPLIPDVSTTASLHFYPFTNKRRFGFSFGPYMSYVRGNRILYFNDPDPINNLLDEYVVFDQRIAMGALYQLKWVSKKGLLFELDFGGGYFVQNNETILRHQKLHQSKKPWNLFGGDDPLELSNLDLRFNANTGFQFKKRKKT